MTKGSIRGIFKEWQVLTGIIFTALSVGGASILFVNDKVDTAVAVATEQVEEKVLQKETGDIALMTEKVDKILLLSQKEATSAAKSRENLALSIGAMTAQVAMIQTTASILSVNIAKTETTLGITTERLKKLEDKLLYSPSCSMTQ